MPSLRETVAAVEAEWAQEQHRASDDDADHSGSSSDNKTVATVNMSLLATAPVAVRRGPPFSVLFIHGLYGGSEFFIDAIRGRPLPPEITVGVPKQDRELAQAQAQHAWLDASVDRRNFMHGEDADAVASCQRAIASGDYHAVVLVDLSDHNLLPTFEIALGPLLRAFAEAAGTVAFTSTEGLLLPPTLRRLFGTPWLPGAYYRTAWTADSGVSQHLVGGALELSAPLRTKACCLTAVPPHERLFSAARAHRPTAGTNLRAVPVDTTDTAESAETTDDGDEARDVVVAVCECGRGRVGYFGDAHCTPATVGILAAFCRATTTLVEPPMRSGHRVRVCGLRARPEHNGACGTVRGRQGKERWQVCLDNGAELALREANLEMADEEEADDEALPEAE